MTTPSVFRLAGLLRLLALAAIPLTVLLPAAVWVLGDRTYVAEAHDMVSRLRLESGVDRAIGLAITLPGNLAVAYGLWRLAGLMQQVRAMAPFSAAAVSDLRVFAAALLVDAVWSVGEPTLRTALLNPVPRTLTLELGMSGAQAWNLMIAGVFFVVVWILREAQRLKEENEGFL